MKDITIVDESLQLLYIMDILNIMIFLQENKNNEIIEKNILFTDIGYSKTYFFCQNLNVMNFLYIENEQDLEGRNFDYVLGIFYWIIQKGKPWLNS